MPPRRIFKKRAVPTINIALNQEIKIEDHDVSESGFPYPAKILSYTLTSCRVCLHSNKNMEHIFNCDKPNYAEKIIECGQINIGKHDGFPQNICDSCVQSLENAYQFKFKCQQSDTILQSEAIKIQNEIIKLENFNIEANVSQVLIEKHKSLPKTTRENDDYPYFESSETCLGNSEEVTSESDWGKESNSMEEDQKRDFVLLDGKGVITSRKEKQIKKKQVYKEKQKKKNVKLKDNIDYESYHSSMSENSEILEENDCNDIDWEPIEEIVKEKKEKNKNEKPQRRIKKKSIYIKNYQCEECGYMTRGPTALEDHKRSQHDGINCFYKCSKCPKTFKRQCYLKCHYKVVHNFSPVVCDLCGKSFKNQILLNNHRKTHSTEKKHKCDYCSYEALTKASIRNHQTTHTGERNFKCNICNKSFRLSHMVSAHIRKIHQNLRPFQCKHCEKSFKDNDMLRKHTVVHTGLKPFTCPLCPATSYSWYNGLTTHQRSLHPELILEKESAMYKKFMLELKTNRS